MGWILVDVLVPLSSAMNQTFDFSDQHVKYLTDGEWLIRWSKLWAG